MVVKNLYFVNLLFAGVIEENHGSRLTLQWSGPEDLRKLYQLQRSENACLFLSRNKNVIFSLSSNCAFFSEFFFYLFNAFQSLIISLLKRFSCDSIRNLLYVSTSREDFCVYLFFCSNLSQIRSLSPIDPSNPNRCGQSLLELCRSKYGFFFPNIESLFSVRKGVNLRSAARFSSTLISKNTFNLKQYYK